MTPIVGSLTPCEPSEWTLAAHVHLRESVLVGDQRILRQLLDRPHRWYRARATRRTPAAYALSPDQQRLLVSVDEGTGLAVSTAATPRSRWRVS